MVGKLRYKCSFLVIQVAVVANQRLHAEKYFDLTVAAVLQGCFCRSYVTIASKMSETYEFDVMRAQKFLQAAESAQIALRGLAEFASKDSLASQAFFQISQEAIDQLRRLYLPASVEMEHGPELNGLQKEDARARFEKIIKEKLE